VTRIPGERACRERWEYNFLLRLRFLDFALLHPGYIWFGTGREFCPIPAFPFEEGVAKGLGRETNDDGKRSRRLICLSPLTLTLSPMGRGDLLLRHPLEVEGGFGFPLTPAPLPWGEGIFGCVWARYRRAGCFSDRSGWYCTEWVFPRSRLFRLLNGSVILAFAREGCVPSGALLYCVLFTGPW
jgi:hypothetical protein